MLVLVMGVSGSGKSTVGRMLADALDAEFLEADSFHPAANIAKMSAGTPLDDADRWPWLDSIALAIGRLRQSGRPVVLACSALKEAYRAHLFAHAGEAGRIVFLDGDCELIARRLGTRQGHYMPPTLLPSQLATLEPPEDALRLDVALAPGEILARIMDWLQQPDTGS